MKTIAVYLCCNDPDNGMPLDYIDAIEVELGDGVLDYGYKVVDFQMVWKKLDDPARIKLGDTIYPIHGYTEWFGNWCWNRVRMAPADVKTLLNYIIRRHKYSHCEDCPDWFSQKFDNKEEFSLAELEGEHLLAKGVE